MTTTMVKLTLMAAAAAAVCPTILTGQKADTLTIVDTDYTYVVIKITINGPECPIAKIRCGPLPVWLCAQDGDLLAWCESVSVYATMP
jgi:hypothetical protein